MSPHKREPLPLLYSLSNQSLEVEDPLMMTIDYMEFESEGSYRITGTLANLGDGEIT